MDECEHAVNNETGILVEKRQLCRLTGMSVLGYGWGTKPKKSKKITLQPFICKDIKKQLRRDSNPCFSLERAAS